MSKFLIALALAGTLVFAGGVVAQQSPSQSPSPGGGHMMHGGGMGMGGMQGGGMMQGMNQGAGPQGMNMQIKGDRSPASLALHAVNAKMHEEMAITFTGEADRDFANAMIAHHQGAIDMAKVVLAFGKDPEVKKLAEQIIQDQEKEVTWMRDWLQRTKK